MKRISPRMRMIAGAVIVLGVAGMILILVKARGLGGVAGESPDGSAAPTGKISANVKWEDLVPFDTLTVNGDGFDENAATSVVFTTGAGETLVIPAVKVTRTTVEVPVPPLMYDPSSGRFNMMMVSFRVVQARENGGRLSVRTSNEIEQMTVLAPLTPRYLTLPGAERLPKGTLTRSFLATALEGLKAAGAKASAEKPALRAPFDEAKKGMEELLADVDTIVKNQKAKVRLETAQGATVTLGASELAWTDAFHAGLLGLIEDRNLLATASGGNSFSLIPDAQAEDVCRNWEWQAEEDMAVLIANEPNCIHNKSVSDRAEIAAEQLPFWAKFVASYYSLLTGVQGGLFIEELGLEGMGAFLATIGESLALDYLVNGDKPSQSSVTSETMATSLDKLGVPYLDQTRLLWGVHGNYCAAFPDRCPNSGPFMAWVDGKLALIGIGEDDNPDVWRIQMPGPSIFTLFENLGIANGGYEAVQTPESEPLPPIPTPAPKPTPKPKDSPVPVSPEPIDVVPVPVPTPKPTPAPVPGPSCSERNRNTYNACVAGCGSDGEIQADYDACQEGCDSAGDLIAKSNCSNVCIGTFLDAKGDKSKCSLDCSNAFVAAECP